MKLRITDIFGSRDKAIVGNDVIFRQWLDVMKYFAEFEKFIPHSIIIPSFMTIESQMRELDPGAFLPPPPYKIGSQNTPYKGSVIFIGRGAFGNFSSFVNF